MADSMRTITDQAEISLRSTPQVHHRRLILALIWNDLCEIWHDYTAQVVKKFEFPKSKMADSRHFENR